MQLLTEMNHYQCGQKQFHSQSGHVVDRGIVDESESSRDYAITHGEQDTDAGL